MKCAWTLSLLIALSACESSAPAPSSEPQSIAYEVLAEGSLSGEHTAGATLITGQDAWREFWQRHTSWREPPEAEPVVDFDKHSVLAVCAGDEPSSGWRLETRLVARIDGRIVVSAELHAPAEDTLSAQMLTQPYQLLLVPRTSGTVELILDKGASTP